MEVSTTQEEAASPIIKVRDITLLPGTTQVYIWVNSPLSLKINGNFSPSETGQKWHFFSFLFLKYNYQENKYWVHKFLGGFLIFALFFNLLVQLKCVLKAQTGNIVKAYRAMQNTWMKSRNLQLFTEFGNIWMSNLKVGLYT